MQWILNKMCKVDDKLLKIPHNSVGSNGICCFKWPVVQKCIPDGPLLPRTMQPEVNQLVKVITTAIDNAVPVSVKVSKYGLRGSFY